MNLVGCSFDAEIQLGVDLVADLVVELGTIKQLLAWLSTLNAKVSLATSQDARLVR